MQDILFGKALLKDELDFSWDALHDHYQNGYIDYRHGVTKQAHQFVCGRCGNHTSALFASFHCHRCHQSCTYCRNCIMMGRVSECTPLIIWTGPPPKAESAKLTWTGMLSPAQQEASNRVVQTIEANEKLLIWAVCGAGKTEILFEGMEQAIQTGKRVCIATPRTDVVIELSPRFQSAFPGIKVATLYGGSDDRHTYSSLTISTTHQLLRFHEAFDVIVVDEVDAFPFSADKTLEFAVEKARKPDSSLIYLSATPNKKLQLESRRGTLPSVIISARFHRKPLPVPTFRWCGNWKKSIQRQKIPSTLLAWVTEHIADQKQAFLFFSHISLMNKALPILQKIDSRIESVHAEDPDRREKVASMRAGDIPILCTTTILERGVTIPNLDVAVLGAEEFLFDESALVQIAGRVGRHPDFPTGEITFFHYGKTEAMLRAKRRIEKMNAISLEKGWVDQ